MAMIGMSSDLRQIAGPCIFGQGQQPRIAGLAVAP